MKTNTQLRFEQRLADMNVIFPVESFNVNEEGIYLDDQIALLYDVYTEGLNESLRLAELNTLPLGMDINRPPTLDRGIPCVITPIDAKLSEHKHQRSFFAAPTYRIPLVDKMATRNVVTHQMAYGIRNGSERMLVAGDGVCLVNDDDIVYAVTLFENYERLYQEFVIKDGQKVEMYTTRDHAVLLRRMSKINPTVRKWLDHCVSVQLPPRFHNPPIVPTLL